MCRTAMVYMIDATPDIEKITYALRWLTEACSQRLRTDVEALDGDIVLLKFAGSLYGDQFALQNLKEGKYRETVCEIAK